MTDLLHKKCIPCEGGTAPLNRAEAEEYLDQVSGWEFARQGKGITKSFEFPDFKSAMAFANQIGTLAEEEGHHPDLTVAWGKVGVSLTTHAIGGLSENDFILAAKVDALQK